MMDAEWSIGRQQILPTNRSISSEATTTPTDPREIERRHSIFLFTG
jgi:hypothetical protein